MTVYATVRLRARRSAAEPSTRLPLGYFSRGGSEERRMSAAVVLSRRELSETDPMPGGELEASLAE
jgi:hypothetical protein